MNGLIQDINLIDTYRIGIGTFGEGSSFSDLRNYMYYFVIFVLKSMRNENTKTDIVIMVSNEYWVINESSRFKIF